MFMLTRPPCVLVVSMCFVFSFCFIFCLPVCLSPFLLQAHVFMYFLFYFDSISSRVQCVWFGFPVSLYLIHQSCFPMCFHWSPSCAYTVFVVSASANPYVSMFSQSFKGVLRYSHRSRFPVTLSFSFPSLFFVLNQFFVYFWLTWFCSCLFPAMKNIFLLKFWFCLLLSTFGSLQRAKQSAATDCDKIQIQPQR